MAQAAIAVWVSSLAQELPHAVAAEKKKKKKTEKKRKKISFIELLYDPTISLLDIS